MRNYLYFVITRKVTGFVPTLLLALLSPLSYLYAATVTLRNWIYECRLFKSKRIPCTVISVGNIASGGTGKTPVVIWIAKALLAGGSPSSHPVGAAITANKKHRGHGSCPTVKRFWCPSRRAATKP